MLTNEQIHKIAREQSAEDIGCSADDFLKHKPVVSDLCLGEKARVYLKEPIACNFVSYGNNVVAAAKPEIKEIATEYVQRFIICLKRRTAYGLMNGWQARDISFVLWHITFCLIQTNSSGLIALVK